MSNIQILPMISCHYCNSQHQPTVASKLPQHELSVSVQTELSDAHTINIKLSDSDFENKAPFYANKVTSYCELFSTIFSQK